MNIYAQNSIIKLGDKTFTKENDKWFVKDKHTIAKNQVNPTSITVKLKKDIPLTALENLIKSKKITIKNINKLGYIDVELQKTHKFYDIYNYYNESNLFDIIEINSFGKQCAIPNDPAFSYQYYLSHPSRPNIHAPKVWDIETGSPSVVIAVIDDGVSTHSDLNLTSPKWRIP